MRRAWLAFVLVASVVVGAGPGARAAEPGAAAGPQSWVGDLSPIADSDWSYARARHLLERAGFGGTPEEIQRLAAMKPKQAVDSLVEYQRIANKDLPRFEESRIYYAGHPALEDTVGDAIRSGYRKGEWAGLKAGASDQPLRLQNIVTESYYLFGADGQETRRLAQWWVERMLNTKRPLEEKLALFWHGHFATSNSKAYRYDLMKQQYETLRDKASGGFKDLLTAVSQDPQMLIWLDNRNNTKEHPNENYAREVMELFTLGVGNYQEKDIRELARAFTGWTIDADGLRGELKGKTLTQAAQFEIRPEIHDGGEKTFLGQTGNFDGNDAIRILLEQKATARFISGKLFRFFARDDASEPLREQLAERLAKDKFEIKPFLKTIFLSKDFYSPASFATQIKSPVQLVVSTYRKLGLKQVPGIPDFRGTTAGLGQELFFPPNVAGWEGGRTWINPATMFARGNFAQQLMFPDTAAPAAGGRGGRNPFAPAHIDGETDAAFDARMNTYFAGATERYLARQRSGAAQVAEAPPGMAGGEAAMAAGMAGSAGGESAAPAGASMAGSEPTMGGAGSMGADGMVAAEASRVAALQPPAQPGMQPAVSAQPASAQPASARPAAEGTDRNARYRSEAYNLGVGFGGGFAKAAARVKPIPRVPAAVQLSALARSAKVETVDGAVDYFVSRFLLVPLEPEARKAMIEWAQQSAGGEKLDLESPKTESFLRKLVVLILSSPEYQLG